MTNLPNNIMIQSLLKSQVQYLQQEDRCPAKLLMLITSTACFQQFELAVKLCKSLPATDSTELDRASWSWSTLNAHATCISFKIQSETFMITERRHEKTCF